MIRKLKIFLFGWSVVSNDAGNYGVYHDTANHIWDYPFISKGDAQQECDRLNNLMFK
jgi:hypothetical protein